jgi:2-amino-4-hydroxy-6-hydroxymethyldihydropteridine diphosphokinase
MHNADTRTFVALGTNLPFEGASGVALLRQAVAAIEAEGFAIGARSGVWRTAAWPSGSGQPDYANAVIELRDVTLSPHDLFDRLAAIEARFGRQRRERWEARTLDLDIVAMDAWVGEFDGIILPHPRIQERVFVLAPLAEVAPDWVHPALGLGAGELLSRLPPEGYARVGDL